MGEAFLRLCKRLAIHARECYTNELSCLECPTHQLATVDKSFIDFHLDMQVKELKKYQPNCSCYIVLTKSDLLEPLPKPEPLLEDQPKELLERCPSAEEVSDSHDDLREQLSAVPCENNEVELPTKKPCDSPISPFDRQSSSENTDRGSHTGEARI